MLINNLVLYEDKHSVQVNAENDILYYYFDYDARSANINMQFQHFHTFYELCIPLCPSTTHFLEGHPYELRMFDIIGIAPSVLHKTQYPPGNPCKRLIIQFSLPKNVTGLSNEYEKLTSIFHRDVPIFRFDAELQKKLYRKINDIYLMTGKNDPMRDLIIHLKFIEFLTLLYLNQDRNIYSNAAEMTSMEQKVYSITSYIHTHFSEDLSLDFLAEKFCISSCYLSHQFKDVTGFTLTDYIQMTRIRNVQSLLISTQTPITELSFPCGFNSFSQFNRVFRKHTGVSPSQYRKEHQIPIPDADI